MHDFQKNPAARLRQGGICLRPARRRGDAGTKVPATRLPPHFFGLAQRNGCGAPKKNAFGACRRRGLSFKALRMSRVVIPSSNGCSAPPTVRCFASLAALSLQKPQGARGRSPQITFRQAPRSKPRKPPLVGGLRPPGAFRSPAPPARAAYYRPILPRKMGHFRKVR